MDWFISLFSEHNCTTSDGGDLFYLRHRIGTGQSAPYGHLTRRHVLSFFVGILAGHLGFTVDPAMRTYAESFGLVIFVYASATGRPGLLQLVSYGRIDA